MFVSIMKDLGLVLLCVCVSYVSCVKYANVTLQPAQRQLLDFKIEHPKPIGLLTTSSGEPVDLRDIIQLNSNQFDSQYHLDLHTNFNGERTPERVVHAKGTGALGHLIVTNDVTKYTSADLFSKVGKKTPLIVRLSSSVQSIGGSDVAGELKGMAIKFYTDEGNLDMLCLQTPVYLYKDPNNFSPLVHAFKRNPKTFVTDTTAIWDFVTLRPDTLNAFFWSNSPYGSPNGYRKMDAFPIHTYEISNKKGDKYYVRFNFRTEQGIENLTPQQIATIQGTDLDYANRDLYNAIGRGEFPSWRMEMDLLTLEDLKKIDYDPFDTTRLWKNGTYETIQIGRLTLDKHSENLFKDIESAAFNPGNLVPGIPGPVDFMFKARRVFYRDTQNYRLGRNHNKIDVNMPKYAKTYVRDGRPPLNNNMKDIPNYYPNSFNGPVPYVDEARPKEKLLVLETNSVDLSGPADFYNNVLQNDAERQVLVGNLAVTLATVTEPIRSRAVKMMYLIDLDLGKRVDVGLKAALLAASAQQSV